ncbi:hypothetical protein LSH36_60g09038 [Paralvinella palmiformis]|uniref:PCNA-associated factor n=1 Tax=Paralvinella palmiformis TaxID=53620 RepID=A0AAD9K5U8_9ANNE|nr:hypothetical protein LSH36_60g09038 [Paralvinella palmiformis]
MVRTKGGDNSRKAVAGKMPRKALASRSSGASSSGLTSPKGSKYGGGNPVCERPTPEWQKDIATFFQKHPKQEKENRSPEDVGEPSEAEMPDCKQEGGSSSATPEASSSNEESKTAPKNNVIESDSDGE